MYRGGGPSSPGPFSQVWEKGSLVVWTWSGVYRGGGLSSPGPFSQVWEKGVLLVRDNPGVEREERLHRDNVPAARRLRKELTPSEAVVWEQLRDRRFHGLKFRRQHPVGAFVLDFFCQEMMFAIEVDGGIHRDPDVAARDSEREAILRERHIVFYRWTAEAVEEDLESLLLALAVDLGIEQCG